tara:strand:+ start:258 stop:497 length:240 start_codon:yes stop_codon:yes gene_type:complete
MDLPYQLFFNISAGLVFTISGWTIRSIYDALEKLKVDLIQLEREIHAKYVEKDDYKDDIRELKSMLTALFDKLDNKADK